MINITYLLRMVIMVNIWTHLQPRRNWSSSTFGSFVYKNQHKVKWNIFFIHIQSCFSMEYLNEVVYILYQTLIRIVVLFGGYRWHLVCCRFVWWIITADAAQNQWDVARKFETITATTTTKNAHEMFYSVKKKQNYQRSISVIEIAPVNLCMFLRRAKLIKIEKKYDVKVQFVWNASCIG